jgi:hypothetical protein
MRPHALLTLTAALLIPSGLSADVLVLLDGRKVSGSVSKTSDEYVVRSEGKTLRFRKSLVDRWCRNPQEYLAEKETLPAEAKAEFLEALRAEDPAAAAERWKAAREKNAAARQAFAETRRLFPESYPDLDRALLHIVRLDRALKADPGGAVPEAATAEGDSAEPLAQAAYDAGAWRASGLFDVGLRRFRVEYAAQRDFGVAYATACLSALDSIARRRDYEKVVEDWEAAARVAATPRQKEHADALAAGWKAVLPCRSCLGTGKARCSTCQGDGQYDVQCNGCGGSGLVRRAIIDQCRVCRGAGRFRNVKCVKCDGTAKVPCKARGCRPRAEPLALSDIAEVTPCAPCGGEGGRFRGDNARCERCFGLGVRLTPKSDPLKTLE